MPLFGGAQVHELIIYNRTEDKARRLALDFNGTPLSPPLSLAAAPPAHTASLYASGIDNRTHAHARPHLGVCALSVVLLPSKLMTGRDGVHVCVCVCVCLFVCVGLRQGW
jgi:hypothetical protein